MKTINELVKWMNDNCYNKSSYAIGDAVIDEGFGIRKSTNVGFVWYYTERGQQKVIMNFSSEEEIVKYAFEQIVIDSTAKSHCVGFLKNKFELKQLVEELAKRKIKYRNDKIPYGGITDPRYRVFVLGCDIKKVLDLQALYNK